MLSFGFKEQLFFTFSQRSHQLRPSSRWELSPPRHRSSSRSRNPLEVFLCWSTKPSGGCRARAAGRRTSTTSSKVRRQITARQMTIRGNPYLFNFTFSLIKTIELIRLRTFSVTHQAPSMSWPSGTSSQIPATNCSCPPSTAKVKAKAARTTSSRQSPSVSGRISSLRLTFW